MLSMIEDKMNVQTTISSLMTMVSDTTIEVVRSGNMKTSMKTKHKETEERRLENLIK